MDGLQARSSRRQIEERAEKDGCTGERKTRRQAIKDGAALISTGCKGSSKTQQRNFRHHQQTLPGVHFQNRFVIMSTRSPKPFCNRYFGLSQWVYTLLAVAICLSMSLPARSADPALAIAAVGPLTGPAAARGKDLDQAVRMAVDEINSAGGINGRQIELTVYDDGDQPARAAELAAKIASTRALAVLGQVASSAGIAAGQVYREKEIPAITGAASESRVTKGNDWFFRTFPDAAGQGRRLADYAHYSFGARRIVVIRETGTAGDEFAASLRDRAKSQGIRIDADLEFLPAQANDAAFMAALA
jgi:ABC-type branched-subunit amino acid transport system substrate-binding protein